MPEVFRTTPECVCTCVHHHETLLNWSGLRCGPQDPVRPSWESLASPTGAWLTPDNCEINRIEIYHSKYIICFIWNRAIITGFFYPPPAMVIKYRKCWQNVYLSGKKKIDDLRKQSCFSCFRAYLFPCLYVFGFACLPYGKYFLPLVHFEV